MIFAGTGMREPVTTISSSAGLGSSGAEADCANPDAPKLPRTVTRQGRRIATRGHVPDMELDAGSRTPRHLTRASRCIGWARIVDRAHPRQNLRANPGQHLSPFNQGYQISELGHLSIDKASVQAQASLPGAGWRPAPWRDRL